jgi:hypothetical protein
MTNHGARSQRRQVFCAAWPLLRRLAIGPPCHSVPGRPTQPVIALPTLRRRRIPGRRKDERIKLGEHHDTSDRDTSNRDMPDRGTSDWDTTDGENKTCPPRLDSLRKRCFEREKRTADAKSRTHLQRLTARLNVVPFPKPAPVGVFPRDVKRLVERVLTAWLKRCPLKALPKGT